MFFGGAFLALCPLLLLRIEAVQGSEIEYFGGGVGGGRVEGQEVEVEELCLRSCSGFLICDFLLGFFFLRIGVFSFLRPCNCFLFWAWVWV